MCTHFFQCFCECAHQFYGHFLRVRRLTLKCAQFSPSCSPKIPGPGSGFQVLAGGSSCWRAVTLISQTFSHTRTPTTNTQTLAHRRRLPCAQHDSTAASKMAILRRKHQSPCVSLLAAPPILLFFWVSRGPDGPSSPTTGCAMSANRRAIHPVPAPRIVVPRASASARP